MKPFAGPAPPGAPLVTINEVHDHAPEPVAPAEPAPAVGVLTALSEFQTSTETATYAATMGRKTSVMNSHVRDRVSEAVNMLQQIAVDAAEAQSANDVAAVSAMIAKLN